MPGFALGNGLIQLTVMDNLNPLYTDRGRLDPPGAYVPGPPPHLAPLSRYWCQASTPSPAL